MVKADSSSWREPPPQSYGTSIVISNHTVLPATRHKWTHPALTPAMQAVVLDLPTSEGCVLDRQLAWCWKSSGQARPRLRFKAGCVPRA